MNDAPHPALLPTGMRDLLPPEAEAEARVVARLMATLAAHGYARVKPPLVEFEETLFSGAGTAMAAATFRTMDPASHRMVGVRADMTPQIARIAATRLGNAARPLRLSYAGQVLRVSGSEIRPERQIGQVGAELIGAGGPAADVEAIAVAGEGLAALGVPQVSVDVTMPTLVPAVAEAYAIAGPQAAALRSALDHKDAAAVAAAAGVAAGVIGRLLAAAGPAEAALVALDRLDLPPRARAERMRLGAVLDGLRDAAPDLTVTVDPVENRGFEYHTGISFTFFAGGAAASGSSSELGRGGRYQAGDPAAPEPATGFTLYTDTILRTLPDAPPPRRLFLPLGAARAHAARLRDKGWITVAALEPAADWRSEARRLGCTHVFEDGEPRALG
ncbi:MAG TPA: ATP phosphoribosyltransferase regulatory subunit [Stellaceae bacterium]|jgi:ATP phosphoribosyltransferase regulatory subunit|nr:ATP phosphoribosyltransferase regulatory subunit [Stellaceae bacterium]